MGYEFIKKSSNISLDYGNFRMQLAKTFPKRIAPTPYYYPRVIGVYYARRNVNNVNWRYRCRFDVRMVPFMCDVDVVNNERQIV